MNKVTGTAAWDESFFGLGPGCPASDLDWDDDLLVPFKLFEMADSKSE